MEAALTENESVETPDDEHDPSVADASLLEDKFPEWFRISAAAAGLVALVSFTYLLFNLRPLWHTDLWGHLSYGRHIWNSGAIPSTEPLMSLAVGSSFVDSSWLCQLMGYGVWLVGGKAALASGFGAVVALALGLILFRVHNRTRSGLFATFAFGLTVWINWHQLAIIRPQAIGFLMFCGLLCVLMRRDWSKTNWWLVPGMFALWANIHGSFVVGLGLLGCFTLGRAIDVVCRSGKPAALLHDVKVRRLLLLTELAAVATLINPYGLGLYAPVLTFGSHPNLASIIEWQPLTISMAQGQAAAVAVLLLFFAYRLSPRRVASAEVLALTIFGASALWTSRMVLWWAPLAAVLIALHGAAAWRKWRGLELSFEPAPRASMWTIVSIGISLVVFQLSHVGGVAIAAIAGKDPATRADKVVVSRLTPVGAAEYLVENPPQGLVFNTYELGDYLQWAGPEGLQVFVNSHAHLAPPDVWNAYMTVIERRASWLSTLDRYGVNAIVLDKQFRAPMIDSLSQNEDWRLQFSDDRTAVFFRHKPMSITDTSQ
jgi:hypothetical protein